MTTVSDPLAEDLRQLHSKQVITITNGFDEDDYLTSVPLTQKFTITYTGEIYPGKRDPTPLFKAISRLNAERRITPDNFELRFYGRNTESSIRPVIKKYDVDEYVNLCGFVPLKESIYRQKESSVLLLLSWNDPREKGVLTGKVFEYMGAKRPILAMGLKDSVLDNLLKTCGCGIMVTDEEEIYTLLSTWINEYGLNGKIVTNYAPNSNIIARYSRRETARQLARVLEMAIEKKF